MRISPAAMRKRSHIRNPLGWSPSNPHRMPLRRARAAVNKMGFTRRTNLVILATQKAGRTDALVPIESGRGGVGGVFCAGLSAFAFVRPRPRRQVQRRLGRMGGV